MEQTLMRLDVTQLMSFYTSPLGHCVQKAVCQRVSDLWGDLTGLDVLGIGYPIPILEGLIGAPRRRLSLMPARQGGHSWQSREQGGCSVISGLRKLPFEDAVFDRVLVFHAMEDVSDADAFLREVWRVCAPEARVILVATNRMSLWSLREETPFGFGRPYSIRQMRRQMRDALLEPQAWTRALYGPPVDWKLFTSTFEGWEQAGSLFYSRLGGVNLVEGIKRLQIQPTAKAKTRVVAPVKIRPGLAQKKG